ncbi:MAG: virulence factor [Romboutsia sp.]
MYAIAFDLDTDMLKKTYHNASIGNAYNDIKNILEDYGFNRQQGSVYFGGKDVNAVTCFEATSELTENLDWFSASVRDMRMLRIEDDNDLRPIIERTTKKIERRNK